VPDVGSVEEAGVEDIVEEAAPTEHEVDMATAMADSVRTAAKEAACREEEARTGARNALRGRQ